jgi:hypothetical protein
MLQANKQAVSQAGWQTGKQTGRMAERQGSIKEGRRPDKNGAEASRTYR